jgi:hypothetical protein
VIRAAVSLLLISVSLLLLCFLCCLLFKETANTSKARPFFQRRGGPGPPRAFEISREFFKGAGSTSKARTFFILEFPFVGKDKSRFVATLARAWENIPLFPRSSPVPENDRDSQLSNLVSHVRQLLGFTCEVATKLRSKLLF